MLCADVVELRWKEKSGRDRRRRANLEDISACGVGLLVEHPVPLTEVRIRHDGGELAGVVRYCVARDNGYSVGVEFAEGHRWSEKGFRPRHLVNPRRLRP